MYGRARTIFLALVGVDDDPGAVVGEDFAVVELVVARATGVVFFNVAVACRVDAVFSVAVVAGGGVVPVEAG